VSARENVLFVFGILMSLVYAAIGIVCLTIPSFLADYSSNIKAGIGIIFIVYSCFRLYRSIQKYKTRNEE
jgi:cytochrome c biogenesis protein CcdA